MLKMLIVFLPRIDASSIWPCRGRREESSSALNSIGLNRRSQRSQRTVFRQELTELYRISFWHRQDRKKILYDSVNFVASTAFLPLDSLLRLFLEELHDQFRSIAIELVSAGMNQRDKRRLL